MRKLAGLAYPARLRRDAAGVVAVAFPDLPEAVTFGVGRADALARAVDALETALSIYLDDGRPLPRPSPARGLALVAPSLLGALKLELRQAMREGGVSRAQLARRMGLHGAQVARLLDPDHASRLDRIEAAMAVLGKRLEVAVKNAA